MKNYAKTHWFATLIIVSLLTFVVVHTIFKISAPIEILEAEWGAGDVLSFVGSIIGTIATIYVLQETISTTATMQKEERMFSIRPYFVMNVTVNSDEDGEELKLSHRVGNLKWQGNINGVIQLQNVGAGNAIVEQIMFSRKTQETGYGENCIYNTVPALLVGEKYMIKLKNCEPGKLTFKMNFTDMGKLGRYSAETEIRIVSGAGRDFIECGVLTIKEMGDEQTACT